jgi:site-specific recombinase XerD
VNILKHSDFVTLPPLLVDYLRYLEVVKNKSDLTVLEYASDIRIFLRYILKSRGLVSNDTPFDEINISCVDLNLLKSISIMDAYAFLSYCRSDRKNDAAIRARRTIAIKRFFRYLSVNMKLLDENPLQELDSPKLKKTLPKYLTLEQSLDLLGCIDGQFKERDYCIITLFLNCGLRLSELVSLNCSDIRSDNTIKVTGKGNKERTLYLNNACVSAIERYLRVRPIEGVKDRNALFISRNKCRINPRTVENIVSRFIKKAGLDGQGFSVHKLRHTAATLMYQYGDVDILLIKEILGHENLSTTEIYTHVVDEQLRKAVESNPLGNVEADKN